MEGILFDSPVIAVVICVVIRVRSADHWLSTENLPTSQYVLYEVTDMVMINTLQY